MKKSKFKNDMKKLWDLGKDDFNKIVKDTSRLIKKGEVQIKAVSKKAEDNLEKIVLSAQREKLCYQLGKTLSGACPSTWSKHKKAAKLSSQISDINKAIKKIK